MAKITVITPTWNQGEFIKDTIESVIHQTHKDLEYIIVDNCSDDGTQELVESFLAQDERIVYVREKDHGQAEAINKGFRLATGEIVCWLNSDDFYYDDSVLEKVNRHFEEGGEQVRLVVGDAWYCDKQKQMTQYNPSDRGVPDWVITRWYFIVQPAVFWRRTDICLDETYHYAFDWKFFIRLFGEGKVLYTHEAYAVYRMYEDNKTGQDNAKRKKEIYRLQKELGVSKLNTAWCRHVYHVYKKAENSGWPAEKQFKRKKQVDWWSRVLFHITGKRICSF